MEDLYRKLGITRDAGVEEISSALEDHEERKDIASILMDERKRAEYDRTHAALMAIGDLRHRLAIDPDYSWFEKNYPDFSAKKILAELSAQKTQPSPEQANEPEKPYEQPRPMKPKTPVRTRQMAVFIALVVIIVAVIFYILL